MTNVGSRDLARELAVRHMAKAEDFPRYMPTIQHWIRSNLFAAAGVGPDEHSPRRGRSRRFPPEALQWARLFATLANRGVATTEIEYLAGVLQLRFREAIDDALARREPDVWLVYSSAPPLTHILNLQIQRGEVRLSQDAEVPGSAVATCINLSRTFAA